MNKFYWILLLILLLGFGLRVFVASDPYLHEWDERYHALVAKNMLNEPFVPKLYKETPLPYNYQDWTCNHIWVHKQPLPLWSMALSMKLFGVNEWALRLPSVLLSTLAIFLTFWIGKELYGDRVGVLAAFFHAINGLIIEITGGRVATDHPDLFFWFFIELGVCMALLSERKSNAAVVNEERKNEISSKIFNLLCGVCIGAAILCKWLPALIVLPLWMILYWKQKNSWSWKIGHFSVLMLGAIAISLPWQIYIHRVFPEEASWEATFNVRHFFEVLDGHEHFILFHFNNLRLVFGELIFLPLAWIVWQFYKNPKRWKLAFLLVWAIVPVLFFTLAKTKMQGYPMFNAPAIFVILALFCTFAARYRRKVSYPKLLSVLLFLLFALPVRYCVERVKPFAQCNAAELWSQKYRTLGERYRSQKVVLLNTKHPIEAMFYTDFIAYSNMPTPLQIQELSSAGYLILYDN